MNLDQYTKELFERLGWTARDWYDDRSDWNFIHRERPNTGMPYDLALQISKEVKRREIKAQILLLETMHNPGVLEDEDVVVMIEARLQQLKDLEEK